MLPPDGFVTPVPCHPAYLVHPDGRVWSHKTGRVLAEHGRPGVWRRVVIDNLEVRVRDLVWLTFGSTGALTEREDEQS